MAPRKAKGGAGGGRKAKDDGLSVLQMNDGPIIAAIPKTDVAKEMQRLDNQVAKCKVGIASINLLEIAGRLKFGVYNDRPEKESETKRLVECFEKSGIVSMKEISAIPLIMKTSRLKDAGKLTKSFDEPEEIIELEMNDLNPILLLDEYSVHEKKREKIRALKTVMQEHIASYNECHDKMCRLKGLLYGIGQWGVIIYDEDKLLEKGTALANHLSRNSDLHEYKETEEEVLITVLKKVKAIFDTSPHDKCNQMTIETLQKIHKEQEKNAHLHKVLHNDNMCMFLTAHLLPLGLHFRHCREYMVNWLAKNSDVCMGMRTTIFKRLGSKAPFPSSAEVSELLDKVDARDAAAIDRVAQLRTSLQAKVKAKDEQNVSIWSSVMHTLNKHTSFTFNDIKDQIGEMAPVDAWGLTNNEDFEENEILAHLDRVIARVMLYLTPEQGKTHAPEPLLCGFLMNNAWDSFMRIKDGLQE
ncbi:hypothetical protein BDR04DRAFT_1123710, partial [Suillus decipiens]